VKSEVARLAAEDTLHTAKAEIPKPLQPPKSAKAPQSPQLEVVKEEAPAKAEIAMPLQPPKSAQAPQSLALEMVKEEPPDHPPTTPTGFIDALSNSVNSGNLDLERHLTIADMADYVRRTYQSSHATDLTMAASY
jgi:hypothetical protein